MEQAGLIRPTLPPAPSGSPPRLLPQFVYDCLCKCLCRGGCLSARRRYWECVESAENENNAWRKVWPVVRHCCENETKEVAGLLNLNGTDQDGDDGLPFRLLGAV